MVVTPMYLVLTSKTQIAGLCPEFLIQQGGEGPGSAFLASAQQLLTRVFEKAVLPPPPSP